MPIKRWPKASTLASLCWRAKRAMVTLVQGTARTIGKRLAAIEMPKPVPQIKTPLATSPRPMASAKAAPKSRVIDGLVAIGPQIEDRVPQPRQFGGDFRLQREPGVITGQRDGVHVRTRHNICLVAT